MSMRIVVVALLLIPGGLQAEEPKLPTDKPVVVDLKSDPEIMKIIDGLKPGESAFLPPVKTTGEINDELKKYHHDKNGPGPRNYCLKWVWAPDRKRALFCGANAGAPHRLNDVWEYDLYSNTWICLWEPDFDFNRAERVPDKEERSKLLQSVAQVEHGVLMTKRGAPFDPIHTWWALTYDPGAKAMLWVMGNENKVGYQYKPVWPNDRIKVWAYYPNENRWEFLRSKDCPPGQNASILEYIPDLKGSLWYTNTWKGSVTSVYNAKSDAWTHRLGKNKIAGNPDCPGAEAVAAYDASRKILVVHHGGREEKGKPVLKRTYHYDITANTWTKVRESDKGPRGFDAAGPMTWDAVSKLSFVNQQGLWAYDPNTKDWTKLTPDGPDAPYGMGCYHPEANVLMVDNGKGRVWVYRHANAAK